MHNACGHLLGMLKIWRKQATPAKRGASILGSLAAMVAVALLIARKPWEWNVPASRGMRIVDYVGILFLVGRCCELPANGRISRERALVDAALPWRPIPSSAAVFPALVLAADPCGHAPLRLVWRAAPST